MEKNKKTKEETNTIVSDHSMINSNEKRDSIDDKDNKVQENIKKYGWFIAWIRKDFIYLFVLILAMLCLVYINNHMTDVVDECNAHWIAQAKEAGCMGYFVDINYSSIPLSPNVSIDFNSDNIGG